MELVTSANPFQLSRGKKIIEALVGSCCSFFSKRPSIKSPLLRQGDPDRCLGRQSVRNSLLLGKEAKPAASPTGEEGVASINRTVLPCPRTSFLNYPKRSNGTRARNSFCKAPWGCVKSIDLKVYLTNWCPICSVQVVNVRFIAAFDC